MASALLHGERDATTRPRGQAARRPFRRRRPPLAPAPPSPRQDAAPSGHDGQRRGAFSPVVLAAAPAGLVGPAARPALPHPEAAAPARHVSPAARRDPKTCPRPRREAAPTGHDGQRSSPTSPVVLAAAPAGLVGSAARPALPPHEAAAPAHHSGPPAAPAGVLSPIAGSPPSPSTMAQPRGGRVSAPAAAFASSSPLRALPVICSIPKLVVRGPIRLPLLLGSTRPRRHPPVPNNK